MAKSSGSGQKVISPRARAVYAFVFRPRESQKPDGQPKYSVTLLFKKTDDISSLKKAALTAAKNKWGDRVGKMKLDSPFHDGNKERQDENGNVDPIFKNMVYLTARSTEKPGIVGPDLEELDQSDFYSGCYCKASLYAFAYDNSGKRGVSFLLNNLQKVGDGKKLSNRLSPEEEFERQDSEDEEPRKGSKTTKGKSRRASDDEDDDPFEE